MASLINSSSIQAMALALAGAAVLFPAEAEACSPGYCAYTEAWQSLEPINAQAIPVDGVLLLQGARSGSSPEEEWLDNIDLTVTRDGQPIAGAVEASGVRSVLMWRPSEPLEPGEYKVAGTFDNPEYDELYDYCGVDFALDFGFTVEAGLSAPLPKPQVGTSSELLVSKIRDLESLVCCDGAMPYSFVFDCGGSGEYVEWGEGFCGSQRGFGTLHVQVEIAAELPPSTSALVVRQLVIDGVPQRGDFLDLQLASQSKPFCAAVLLTNIATSESVLTEEFCFGSEPELVAQLGEHAIDPSDDLSECAGAAYTCEVDQDRWRPDRGPDDGRARQRQRGRRGQRGQRGQRGLGGRRRPGRTRLRVRQPGLAGPARRARLARARAATPAPAPTLAGLNALAAPRRSFADDEVVHGAARHHRAIGVVHRRPRESVPVVLSPPSSARVPRATRARLS